MKNASKIVLLTMFVTVCVEACTKNNSATPAKTNATTINKSGSSTTLLKRDTITPLLKRDTITPLISKKDTITPNY